MLNSRSPERLKMEQKPHWEVMIQEVVRKEEKEREEEEEETTMTRNRTDDLADAERALSEHGYRELIKMRCKIEHIMQLEISVSKL